MGASNYHHNQKIMIIHQIYQNKIMYVVVYLHYSYLLYIFIRRHNHYYTTYPAQSVFIANAKKCGLLSTDEYKFSCNVPYINTVLSNGERS